MPAQAMAATPMKGGMVLSPLPLGGGKRGGKKTARMSKKMLKMLKKMSKTKLAKLMKGGEDAADAMVAPAEEKTEEAPATGARRRGGKTRRGSRKSRRSGLLY